MAREIIPFEGVLVSSQVKAPYAGMLYHEGKILPVRGPIPSVWEASDSYQNLPFLLILEKEAQVILGLPNFLENKNAEPLATEGASPDGGNLTLAS